LTTSKAKERTAVNAFTVRLSIVRADALANITVSWATANAHAHASEANSEEEHHRLV
jgi:hypothetical protein